jgi:hypothetical protein
VATVRNALVRVAQAWGALAGDQRLAAGAALAVLVAMFLPWYSSSSGNHTASAWAAVTFVEAALFLVSAGVVLLLFYRAEQRAFHLPGGDGGVIFAAGIWDTFLVLWRVFDQPDLGPGSTGLQWGIFFAFVATGTLAYAGWRMRMARPLEPTKAEDPTTKVEPLPPEQLALTQVRRRRRVAGPDSPTEIAGQMSFEDDPSET